MQLNLFSSFVALALSMGLVKAAPADATAEPAATQGGSSKLTAPEPLVGADITFTDFQIVPNTADITAECATSAGPLRSSTLSLGSCFGNNNGALGC
jgi:hypothetical protein